MPPLVSIGLPVFNGERYIREALDSLLAQTYPHFELIVSDNASTDATASICQEYVARDSRIRLVRQPVNIGAPANYNEVFRLASGDYFRWTSSNDLAAPSLLERCLKRLCDHPDAVVCYPRTRYIDARGEPTSQVVSSPELVQPRPSDRFIHLIEHLQANNIYGGLFRTAALRRTGLERLHPGGDLVLLAELALLGTFIEVPEPLYLRRMTSETATVHRSPAQIKQLYDPANTWPGFWIRWPLLSHFLGVALRGPLPPGERLRLTSYVLKLFYWSRGDLWNECRHNFNMCAPIA